MTTAKEAFAKVKKESVSTWKKKVWRVVSPYIRQRDADAEGMVKCCSCENVRHWKQMDAGHFLDGRRNANLFDIRGIHAQCKMCNGNLNRQPAETKANYRAFILKRYGQEVIDELEAQDKTRKEFTVKELKSLYEYFSSL